MKTYFFIFLLMLLEIKVFSQHSLSGTITNKETKETLPGANIYFPDLHKGVTSDINGFYKVVDLPKGKFLVEVRFIGYAIQILKIDIHGETKVDFELEESHTELNEVVITGASAALEKAINPVQTLSVNKATLNQTSSSNIIDAVSNQPGISQITTGAGISKPVIRGLGYNRVVILQNNIRQEGQQWGDEHGIEIDEFSIDRVEIIKGPGSLIYGSDAMAGVINFLPPNPVEAGKITSVFMSSYHTNNHQMGYSLQNSGNKKGVYWLVQGTRKQVGNYSNAYDGKVYNSGFNELNLNGSVGIGKKWGYAHVNFSTFNQNMGVIEGERDSLGHFFKYVIAADTILSQQTVTDKELNNSSLSVPRQGVNHHRISSTSKFIFHKSLLALTFGWQQNQRKEFSFLQQSNGNIKEDMALYFLLNTFNYDITYFLPEIKEWETAIGINGMQQNNKNKGKEFLIPEYAFFDAGIFTVTQKTVGNLHLSGGARYNIRTIDSKELLLNKDDVPTTKMDSTTKVKFLPFQSTYTAFSYSLGVSYRFHKNVVGKVNVSSGFRAPNLAELASNGNHEGSFRYEIGNAKLRPEISFQTDAGFLYNTKHISLELDGFSNSIQHYIFAQKLHSISGGDSVVMDNTTSISAFKFIQGNANLIGGEVIIDFHPHPFDWLHFENSFSFVQGIQSHQPDSSKYLPFMPAPKFQTQLRAQFNKAGKQLKNFYVNLELDYFFEQNKFYSAYGTETYTPSYSLLNTSIGADVINKKGQTLFSIFLTASNLFDIAFQTHLSRLKYAPENIANGRVGVFNMGRNFNIKLILPLVLGDF